MSMQIGLTGGPGCGKTAASGLFDSCGFAIIDTDVLAREVVEPGRPACARLLQEFGPDFFDSAGGLIREKLAALVFTNPAARRHLNAILHPEIRALWQSRAAQLRGDGRAVIVVIPLLFESHLQTGFDRTLCIGCSPAVQRERLRLRGWSDATIQSRLAAQWPLEEKCRLATHLIWNDGSLDLLRRQILALARAWQAEKSK